MKSLGKNSFFNILYTLLNLLFPLATSMYVSRVIQPTGVGAVAYAQSIASYFVVLASLGIPVYGIREIAKKNNNQIETDKLFSELFTINFVGTAISLFSYFLLVFFVESFENNLLLFSCCGLLIFFNFFNVDWLYKGKEEYGYIVLRSLIVKVISFVSVLLFVRTINDFCVYAFISSLAVGGNNIFNIIHSKKYARFTFSNLKLKKHLVPVFVLAISLFFERVYGKIDTTMLGIFAGEASTGIYSYGHKTIELALSISTAITAVFMPRLSYAYETSEECFHSTLSKGLNIITFFSFPMCVGLAIIAPVLTSVLYGSSFIKSATVIRWLSPLLIVNSFGDLLCYQTIIAVGLEKSRLPAAIFGTFLNIILNYFLIRSFSEIGAAISSVVSEVFVNIFLILILKKKIRLHYSFVDLFKVLVACFLMLFAVMLLQVFVTHQFLELFLCVFVGAATYFVFTNIFKTSSAEIINRQIGKLLWKKQK